MRCLIIEDDVGTAQYIQSGLTELGHLSVLADNGVDGLYLATQESWDAVILDRMLPGQVDGMAILSTMRSLGKQTPVVILSALASLDERVHGLRSGADDYLTKPFAFEELKARLDAVIRRSSQRDEPFELTLADLKVDLRSRRVERGGKIIHLQPREFRLLEFLLRHRDQVVTRTMLLEGVWDYHFDPQTGVVDVQISRLRQKIDKDFERSLIHTVRGAGYMISAHG